MIYCIDCSMLMLFFILYLYNTQLFKSSYNSYKWYRIIVSVSTKIQFADLLNTLTFSPTDGASSFPVPHLQIPVLSAVPISDTKTLQSSDFRSFQMVRCLPPSQSKLSILSFELWKSAAPAPGPQHGHGNFVEKESFGTDEAKPSEIRWNVLDLKRPSCHFVWYVMLEVERDKSIQKHVSFGIGTVAKVEHNKDKEQLRDLVLYIIRDYRYADCRYAATSWMVYTCCGSLKLNPSSQSQRLGILNHTHHDHLLGWISCSWHVQLLEGIPSLWSLEVTMNMHKIGANETHHLMADVLILRGGDGQFQGLRRPWFPSLWHPSCTFKHLAHVFLHSKFWVWVWQSLCKIPFPLRESLKLPFFPGLKNVENKSIQITQ